MNFKYILFLTVLFYISQHLNAQQPSASQVMEIAYTEAIKDNKNVMVIFTASWCGWCKRMLANMNSENCKALFDRNYVVKQLVVKERQDKKHLENPGAMELLKQNKAERAGIPFFLIYDAGGNLLTNSFDNSGMNLGCPASEKEVSVFIEKLRKTSDLTDEELAVIRETFILKK